MSRILVLCALVVFLPTLVSAGDTKDSNLQLVERFYNEVVNGGNLDLLDELTSEDFKENEVFPGLSADRAGVKEFFRLMRAAFPDLKFDVHFMMADDDKVAAYITMSGTHKGEFMGMPPTGKSFSTQTIDIIRIVNGKAVEHWGATNTLTMMEQLGAVPESAPPAKEQ